MSCSVIPSEKFKKEAKRLIKKFPSLKQELAGLNNTLTNEPETGTPMGNNTYKIRLAVKSKGKGKGKRRGADATAPAPPVSPENADGYNPQAFLQPRQQRGR